MIKIKKEIKEICEICDEFLQIPATTGFEMPFLNYLNKKIIKLGYNTILKKNYLTVTNSNPKNLFSIHIDRQGLILNEDKKIEYCAFYMKKQIGEKFSRELNDENEQKLIGELNLKFNEEKFIIKNDLLRIKSQNNQYYNFQRGGNAAFFEKVALRYIRESISSYNVKTGEILDTFKTTRYDLNLEKNEISFELNKELKKEDKVFMLNSKINLSNNLISAQIDNVISAAVIFYLLKHSKFENDVIFTTGEEYGNSWSCVTQYIEKSKKENLKLIVLDTSPYPNLNLYGNGFITLRYGDERSGFNNELVEKIKLNLEKEKIPYDFKPSYMGKTELGKIVEKTNGKINGVTIQLPTTNYHTTYESATIKSVENYLSILKKF